MFDFRTRNPIPTQLFRVSKLLILNILFLLRNIFVTLQSPFFTTTYQEPLLEENCLKSPYSSSKWYLIWTWRNNGLNVISVRLVRMLELTRKV